VPTAPLQPQKGGEPPPDGYVEVEGEGGGADQTGKRET
jgi:hypothetical protein